MTSLCGKQPSNLFHTGGDNVLVDHPLAEGEFLTKATGVRLGIFFAGNIPGRDLLKDDHSWLPITLPISP